MALRETSQRSRASRGRHILLACVLIMVATVLVSLSRGGGMVAVTNLVVAIGLMLRHTHHRGKASTWLPLSVLFAALICGVLLGGPELRKRAEELKEGFRTREEGFKVAERMTKDFPWFGTGPETFQPVFLLYKVAPEAYAPGQVHNDWLETRITFGWVGFLLILASLCVVGLRWLSPGGAPVPGDLVWGIGLAMGGCLVHARWDLPFQVYSIAWTFLLLCAVLFTASKNAAAR